MSFKELIKDPSVWMLPISNIITWYLARPKKKAELVGVATDVRIKERDYDARKIEQLLDRVAESDKIIEDLLLQIRNMSRMLEKALTENNEIRAELNLYKTIK